MADKQKSLGHTVLGWFVVQEEEAAAGSSRPPGVRPSPASADAAADDLIARYAAGGPAGPQGAGAPRPAQPPAAAGKNPAPAKPAQPAAGPVLPVTKDGAIDFAEVFRQHGVSAEQQGHVERALTLLHNLPKETPNEVKRQIVGASLLAFGFPVERIIESAALHLKALDAHVQKGQAQTQHLLDEANSRLKALEAEAARIKLAMQQQLEAQQALGSACQQQQRKVQEVLDFFGAEAVARVTSASPKLREP